LHLAIFPFYYFMIGEGMPKIDYDLIRTHRKTISITITQQAVVVVRAPLRAPKSAIAGFIEQKREWIEEKRALMLEHAEARKLPAFESGEEFPYIGRTLMLIVTEKARRIEACGDTLIFPKARLGGAGVALKRWYVSEARRVIAPRLEAWTGRTGILCAGMSVSGARKRWGSCSGKGRLSFAWRLVMAPVDVIDYVIVHELAHIEHHNHSKAFWALVGEIMPDYKVKKRWLKENSALLVLF
jgi:predicted metal-dependent hydrolase